VITKVKRTKKPEPDYSRDPEMQLWVSLRARALRVGFEKRLHKGRLYFYTHDAQLAVSISSQMPPNNIYSTAGMLVLWFTESEVLEHHQDTINTIRKCIEYRLAEQGKREKGLA